MSGLLDPPPIERRGLPRDASRLLVASGGAPVVDGVMRDLPGHLDPGDLLVVNLSATIPAAIDAGSGLVVHLATPLPGGDWLVELRRACRAGTLPYGVLPADARIPLAGGAELELLEPHATRPGGGVRLWRARLATPVPLLRHLSRHGRPIRYGCAGRAWPIDDYQTVFSHLPGSAEMPSAGRGFTPRLLDDLARRGIGVAPVVLHAGVSSPEAGEPPAPERYRVPASTARRVDEAHERGGRVVAVGTTVVRALETDARDGRAHPGRGWTELVVDPERGVRVVDGILTGWHEPEASHLHLLAAVAGPDPLARSEAASRQLGHRRHEFGDFNLLLAARNKHRSPRTGHEEPASAGAIRPEGTPPWAPSASGSAARASSHPSSRRPWPPRRSTTRPTRCSSTTATPAAASSTRAPMRP